MGSTKKIIKTKIKQKIISSYIVALLLLSSFIGLVQIAKAEPNDIIVTYDGTDPDTPINEFDNGSMVVINITVDGTTGDAGYMLQAVAGTSGQEVWFPVFDNDTNPPWSSRNNPGDGVYWGALQIGGNVTDNSSTPRYLHLDNSEQANISEILGGNFDGDGGALVVAKTDK